MKYVHVSAKVEHRIENLRKSGKAGNVLAQKVTSIIKCLTSGAWDHREVVSSHTKYGEKRIKNCRKYDLACGYRLITLQRRGKVFIAFLGTHDECQRWLENNSSLKAVAAGKGRWFRIDRKKRASASQVHVASVGSDEGTEDELEMEVSDRDLRRVFSGLVEGPLS